jgi:MFS family permease
VPREDLMNAIALNSVANNLMRVVGPTVAGLLIALSGPALNFGIQSVAYVLVFLLVLPLKTPYSNLRERRKDVSMAESFIEGLKYIRQQRMVLGLMLLALVPTLFTTPINLGLLPVFAHDVLKVDSKGLGLMYSVQGMGAVVGTLTLASLGNYRKKGLLLSVAAVCLATAITLYSQVTVFLLALPLLAVGTCCFMTYNTLNQTIIQTITPDEYLGRVMGLLWITNGLSPLGSFIFGSLAEWYGVQTSIMIAGGCAFLSVGLILALYPSIRSFRSGVAAETSPPETGVRPAREALPSVRPATD